MIVGGAPDVHIGFGNLSFEPEVNVSVDGSIATFHAVAFKIVQSLDCGGAYEAGYSVLFCQSFGKVEEFA